MILKFQLLREIYSKQSTWTKGNDINTINKALKEIGIKFGLTSQEMTNCFNNDKLTNIVLEERINAQKNLISSRLQQFLLMTKNIKVHINLVN